LKTVTRTATDNNDMGDEGHSIGKSVSQCARTSDEWSALA